MISTETAPPGAMVQIKLALAKPAALYAGELALDLDPTGFGPVTAIATFSAAGDGSGFATVNGSHLDIHFQSPSGTLGSAAGMPLAVITVPILATAKQGTQAAINADPSGSQWRGMGPINSITVTPGSVTIGGSLSVSDVSPVSNLAAGAVVHIHGAGFTSATTVDIAAVSVASVQLVGPQEIDVTLAGPADFGAKQITVRNPGGSQVTFFAAPTAQPLSTLGSGVPSGSLDGALPLFPVVSYPAGQSDAVEEGFNFGRLALANPNSAPVDVLLKGVGDPSTVLHQVTITIPAGGAYDSDFSSLVGTGIRPNQSFWAQVFSTAPLRMLELIPNSNTISHPPSSFVIAPLSPIGIPPLTIVVPSSAATQFSWVTGTPPPQPHTFTLAASPTGDDVGFTVSSSTTSGGDWLSVTPASGTTAAPVLTVTARPSGLAPGAYHGVITITPVASRFQPANGPVSIPVALTVTSTPLVNHIILPADFTPGIASGLTNTLHITPDMLPGGFTVDVITDSGGNWLAATPTSGMTPAQLQLTASPGDLGPGVYAGTVTVNGSGGNTIIIQSILTVYGGAQFLTYGSRPVFAMRPGGPPSAPQVVNGYPLCSTPKPQICPPSEFPTNWISTPSTQSGGNWLQAVYDSGLVKISVDPPPDLLPGLYTGVVTLTSDQAASTQIPVALNVWTGPVPALFVDPPTLSLTSAPFASPIPGEGVICTSTGSLNVQQTAQATTSIGGNWLGVNVSPDVTPSCIRLSLDASNLDAGVYQGDVTISVPGQSVDVPVTLTIPPPPFSSSGFQPLLGAVLDAASNSQGAIAPGEIIAIRGMVLNYLDAGTTFTLDSSGHVPTSLASTEVLVNGKPAPLLYVSASQINAIVPYEVAGQSAATVQVLFNGGSSQIWSMPIAPAAPGIFTLDATGTGPVAVLNQDNSVNGPTQPAARGSVIQIFATGIPVRGAVTGSVTPAAAPGSTDPVSVAIGGVTASILYAGPAPGEIAGLIQVNAVVSDLAPTGPTVPIVLSVSPPQGRLGLAVYASQTGATIAVQ